MLWFVVYFGKGQAGAPGKATNVRNAVAAKPELLQSRQRLQSSQLPDLVRAQLQQPQVCELLHRLHIAAGNVNIFKSPYHDLLNFQYEIHLRHFRFVMRRMQYAA